MSSSHTPRYEGYEIPERHRRILIREQPYLLKNIYVTEDFWAMTIANELLTPEMVEECKVSQLYIWYLSYSSHNIMTYFRVCYMCVTTLPQVCATPNQRKAKLLELIPQRGPDAFYQFCDALMAGSCDYVVRYLNKEDGKLQWSLLYDNYGRIVGKGF